MDVLAGLKAVIGWIVMLALLAVALFVLVGIVVACAQTFASFTVLGVVVGLLIDIVMIFLALVFFAAANDDR